MLAATPRTDGGAQQRFRGKYAMVSGRAGPVPYLLYIVDQNSRQLVAIRYNVQQDAGLGYRPEGRRHHSPEPQVSPWRRFLKTDIQPRRPDPLGSAFVIAACDPQAGRSLRTPRSQAGSLDRRSFPRDELERNGPADRPYDVLYVIDLSEETLFIYYIDNANSPATSKLELKNGAFLPPCSTPLDDHGVDRSDPGGVATSDASVHGGGHRRQRRSIP